MESEKENMQSLLERFSTTVDSSNVNRSFLEKLPSTPVYSSSSSSKVGSPTDSSCSNNTTAHVNNTSYYAGTDLLSVCRICQLPGDGDDILFSPCRCSGSLKSVHYNCLVKWIDISTRKTKKIPRCELCQFFYVRHKRFKFHNWRMPHVSRRDKCLHIIFLITLVVMVICAVATVMCFLSDNGQISQGKTYLSTEEVITLTCGVMFFVSFFLAMTVEIKARHTIYRLFVKFICHNTEWQIEAYDKNRDADCPKPYIYNT
ncbi:unnamed protein product [Candidula unifasciata]|uniref:RING-CH-type domain-containing protein n=1 Tax=Candidula unifasciata TaxID=100452 RepID=A0A8S3YWW1_9EUPU|nr:unnamed protein product [Candidula unifasciata]